MPGRPGRGYDPTPGFTDLQWYLFHQRNIAYFAAFSARDYDERSAVTSARLLVRMMPQLATAFRGAAPGRRIPDEVLARIVSIETVDTFDGFPEHGLDDGMSVYADAEVPFFRIRVARLADGPDAAGRRSFVLVWVSHVFVEGTDSAELSRSRPAAHPEAGPAPRSPAPIVFAARLFAAFAIPGHLLASRVVTPHPGRVRCATQAVPRRKFADMARALGVRQRALMMALTAHVISGAGLPGGKRKISTTYSTLGAGGGAHRDPFMRMRMLFAAVENRDDFAGFARALDARLSAAEARESGFNAEMNAAAVRFHRRLARWLPFLYGPKVFAFMPYDLVFALIPPHRLAGPLVGGLLEPVYAGATMPGSNGCVVVPGRAYATFNFYLEEALLPNLARLDRILNPPH